MSQSPSLSRRRFLQAGAVCSAAPLAQPARLLGMGRPSANERIHVGIIGLGGRARDIAATCHNIAGMRIVAVCDCFAPRCDEFVRVASQGQKWATYDDFRRMIDGENLDALMIETTTHARAWITVLAMQAGLDVYIEKPMCLSVSEGRHMVRAARRYGRVTQVGTQQRSMPINSWASDLVKQGAIGKVHTVLAPNFVGPLPWTDKPAQPMPSTGNGKWWEVWINQTPMRPYHADLHFGWARWNDYDGGGLSFGVSGWGTHSYDQINRALGTDETGPVEVVLEEPVQIRPSGRFEPRQTVGGVVLGDTGDADTGVEYHAGARLNGPRAKVSMRFASGTQLKLHLDGDRGPGLGAIFMGDKGKIEINRNRVASNPRELTLASDNPGPNTKPETHYHVENWLDCIRTRARCTADVEYGQRSTTLCQLVNIARAIGRVGEVLRWDPNLERFTNCAEANALLSRERRPGYELPDIA